MRTRLVIAGAVALIFGGTSAALAASPSGGTVGPSQQGVSWSGKNYTVGATAGPGACPAAADPLNALCDHFDLTVDADSSYWSTHSGGVSVAISWGSSGDNFDLYVYRGGSAVASSASSGTKSESVYLSEPSGTYEVRVVPKNVSFSAYSGSASFSATDDGPPDDGGGSGGGDSGGGGGGDSGGGGGDSGGGGGGSGGGGGGSGGSGSGGGGSGGSGGGGSGGGSSSIPKNPFAGTYVTPSGSASQGGLYYGGGTNHFDTSAREGTLTSSRVYYQQEGAPQPALARPGTEGTEIDQQPAVARAEPVAVTPPRIPDQVWLLLPVGLMLLAAVGYVVFEPADPVAGRRSRGAAAVAARPAPPPVSVISLAGVTVRSFVATGRALVRLGRWVSRNRGSGS